MKPCKQNRKRIVWLALGHLEPEEAMAIQSHVDGCESCQNYLEEILTATGSLKRAEPAGEMPATQSFHQRVVRAVRESTPRSTWDIIGQYSSGLTTKWRVAVPAGAAIVVAFLFLASHGWRRPRALRRVSSMPLSLATEPNRNLPITVASAWTGQDWSPEQFEEQLSLEAGRRRAPEVSYTASMGVWLPPP